MSRRDYRCAFSGVSLLDAEVGVILLQRIEGIWKPAGLPLWGRYDGLGTAADVNDGPNADLILAALQRLEETKELEVDFAAMGLAPCELDHIETVLSVIACSQINELDAVRTKEGPLGFSLLSAHVAAAVMEGEPELSNQVLVEGLPERVFDAPLGRKIYAPLRQQSAKLRCKFGITLAGSLALDQEMGRRELRWAPNDAGVVEEDANPALWMAEAMVRLGDNAQLVEALQDYAGQEPEAE